MFSMQILVVDDEPDVQPLFEQRFRKEIRSGEITFVFAHSGEEALAYLLQHFSEVVLILSDINMPGMSGLELLRRIKQTYTMPPPTIMLVTAYSDQENYNQALRLGADGFLTKPLDFAALKEKLQRVKSA
jgi:CheY-like chemotaxis protein